MPQSDKRLFDIAEQSVKSGLALFTGDALSTLILAIGSILMARFLGPEGYGLYSLTLTMPTIMLSLIALGIDQAVIRFPARLIVEDKPDRILSILKSAVAFRFLTALVMWLICFLFSGIFATHLLNRPEIGFYIKISSFLIITQSFFTLLYNVFIGLGISERGAAIKILMSIIKSTLAPTLIIIGLGIVGAITAHVLSYAAASLSGVVILYLDQYRKLKALANKDELPSSSFAPNLRLMISYGLPLYISSLLLILMDQYRLLLLAHNVSDLEIGNFQAAGNFVALLTVISAPMALAIFPAFSKLEAGSSDMNKAFQYSVKYTSMVLAPASAFTIVMSRSMVEIVYGHEYALAPLFLSLYAAIYLYSVFGSVVLGNFFSGIGDTMVNLRATLIYSAIFAPLATILTYLYHVPGLIVSILISSIANIMYCIHMAARKYAVGIDYQTSIRILLASWIAALTLVPFTQNTWLPNYISLIIGIIIYPAAYLTILPILKALNKTDLENLNMFLGRYKLIKPIMNLITKYESKIIWQISRRARREN
ncbi:MAG: oligosaccharide flippase family protein [Candidatus Bathyarchaeia archaeon]